MKRSDYNDSKFGSVLDDFGGVWPHGYYLPRVIPRDLALTLDTQRLVDQAQYSLGQVSGLTLLISNPDVLLAPTFLNEALSSSRIEGTQASLSSVVVAEAEPYESLPEALREIRNYILAMKQGVDLLDELPITQRLICELHSTLLRQVRGEEKTPGEFRKSPVWIGSPGGGPEVAKFIPPIASRIPELLSDWERYVNSPSGDSIVIRCALMHYQFETIHPFLDGNGRIGRLLISLLMIQDGILSRPVLNLSSYIERFRTEYYERLQAVRENGLMDDWIAFFAKGVIAQCAETVIRLRRLVELREKYRHDVEKERTRISSLIDLLFMQPIVTVKAVQSGLSISQPTAAKLLNRAEALGWLRPMPRIGRGGKQHWFAWEVWAITTNEQIDDRVVEGADATDGMNQSS